jgi:pimeloyl-ACP methyl ester carboxylesterase
VAIETAGDGPAVLVFHGTPGSRLDARFWAAAAAEAGIEARFIGFDRPGYGAASAEPERTLDSVAEQAAAIADGPVRLLAVSGGGPFALAAAAVLGERASSVTIASGMGPPSCGLGALAVIGDMTEAEVRSWANELIAAEHPAPTGTEVLDLFLASQAEGIRGPDGIVEDVLTLREAWTTDLATITAPVRLFHALDDESCRIEGARFLAAALPRAELVEWPNGGHLAAAFHLAEVLGRVVT